jgi:hypothetical protein
VLGPGADKLGVRVGIRSYWVCGSTREILLEENYVEGFATAGLEVAQSSDVQVTCNTVFNCFRALDVFEGQQGSSDIRFKRNWFEVTSGDLQVVRTDDNLATKLGPVSPFRGDNGLMAEDQHVDFILEDDPDANEDLNVRHSYWFLYNEATQSEQFLDALDSGEITARISPSTLDVLWNPFRTVDDGVYCRAEDPPTAIIAGHRQVAAPEAQEGRSGGAPPGALGPAEVSFEVRSTGTGGSFIVGVPGGGEGRYVVEIFDVRGRRVVTVVDDILVEGFHAVQWDGRDRSGAWAVSGVYFARLRGTDAVVTRKIVRIQ